MAETSVGRIARLAKNYYRETILPSCYHALRVNAATNKKGSPRLTDWRFCGLTRIIKTDSMSLYDSPEQPQAQTVRHERAISHGLGVRAEYTLRNHPGSKRIDGRPEF